MKRKSSRQFHEDMQARFVQGTFARIAAALEPGEDRTDFVREAVDELLKKRERARKKTSADSAEGQETLKL